MPEPYGDPDLATLAESIAAAAYGADCRYHGTDRGMTDDQLWSSHYVKDGGEYAQRGHYRLMANAALSVVSPLLAAKDAVIAQMRVDIESLNKAANYEVDRLFRELEETKLRLEGERRIAAAYSLRYGPGIPAEELPDVPAGGEG